MRANRPSSSSISIPQLRLQRLHAVACHPFPLTITGLQSSRHSGSLNCDYRSITQKGPARPAGRAGERRAKPLWAVDRIQSRIYSMANSVSEMVWLPLSSIASTSHLHSSASSWSRTSGETVTLVTSGPTLAVNSTKSGSSQPTMIS